MSLFFSPCEPERDRPRTVRGTRGVPESDIEQTIRLHGLDFYLEHGVRVNTITFADLRTSGIEVDIPRDEHFLERIAHTVKEVIVDLLFKGFELPLAIQRLVDDKKKKGVP